MMIDVFLVTVIILLIITEDVSESKISVNSGKSVESVKDVLMDGQSTAKENVLLPSLSQDIDMIYH